MITLKLTKTHNTLFGSILIAVLFVALVFAVYTFLPVHQDLNLPYSYGWGIDWKGNIRLASLDMLSGQTPYINTERCYPPWIYLLVYPVAVLPPAAGSAVIFVLTYMVYLFVVLRLKSSPWAVVPFMLNSFIAKNAMNANLDFLAVLGFVLPPQVGLFFVLSKPQIGFGIALFWLIEAWRREKFREVLRIFAPVTVAYLISFLIFGLWPLQVAGMTNSPFNASLWPIGIPVGLILLYKSIRDRNPIFSMGASPFLAPYVNSSSFAVVLIPMLSNPILMLIVSALTWL